jgi:FKBP-type peptidyl-prolyl cis-trans isomerase FkpA
MKKFLFLAFLIAPCITMAQATFQRTPKGVQYRIVTNNTGDRIKQDNVITFNVAEKTEKDSVLFSSYTAGHPIQIQIKPSANIGDLMDIFPLLTVKDSAIVRVPTDSVFVGHEESRPPFLPKGSNIIFTVKVERVQTLDEAIAERNAALAAQNAAVEKMKTGEGAIAAKYIADHKLVLNTTPSGLKYVITHPSVKRKIQRGDTLLVNYAGRTTEDKLFDSSIETVAREGGLQQPGRNYEPLPMVVGTGQVIKGWDEGLLLLNEGSKATFVIPSNLAYGDQGGGDMIKPYSTLIFDVEVVKVTPGKVIKPKPGPAKKGAPVKKAGATTAKKPVAKTAAKAPVKK